jgi:hypothetical protein
VRVRIIDREVPAARLHEQNRRRMKPVPAAAIARLPGRRGVPDQTEAHRVSRVVAP